MAWLRQARSSRIWHSEKLRHASRELVDHWVSAEEARRRHVEHFRLIEQQRTKQQGRGCCAGNRTRSPTDDGGGKRHDRGDQDQARCEEC